MCSSLSRLSLKYVEESSWLAAPSSSAVGHLEREFRRDISGNNALTCMFAPYREENLGGIVAVVEGPPIDIPPVKAERGARRAHAGAPPRRTGPQVIDESRRHISGARCPVCKDKHH